MIGVPDGRSLDGAEDAKGRAAAGPDFTSADLGGNAGGDFTGGTSDFAAPCSESWAAFETDVVEDDLEVGGINTGDFATAGADFAAASSAADAAAAGCRHDVNASSVFC